MDRPDALPVIGTVAARTLVEMLDPGVWPAALHATGRPALVVGPNVVEGSRPSGSAGDSGHRRARNPGALAQAACTWADTFDTTVSVVDVVGEGGLARREAQYTLREVSHAMRRNELPARDTRSSMPMTWPMRFATSNAAHRRSLPSPRVTGPRRTACTGALLVTWCARRTCRSFSCRPTELLSVEPGTGRARGASRRSGSLRSSGASVSTR